MGFCVAEGRIPGAEAEGAVVVFLAGDRYAQSGLRVVSVIQLDPGIKVRAVRSGWRSPEAGNCRSCPGLPSNHHWSASWFWLKKSWTVCPVSMVPFCLALLWVLMLVRRAEPLVVTDRPVLLLSLALMLVRLTPAVAPLKLLIRLMPISRLLLALSPVQGDASFGERHETGAVVIVGVNVGQHDIA